MTMQNDAINSTEAMMNSVKQAFAPVSDALKNVDVPEATRDFVRRAATTAKERAADFHSGSDKVTSAIENAVSGSVSEAAKISRNVQQAMYDDAEAFFSGIEKLSGAKSVTEAFQIQSDMLRSSSEVFVARAKASTEYLGKLFSAGAKTAQDNLSKVASGQAA